MSEVVIMLYLVVIAALLLSDVARGLFDAAQQQPNLLRQASQLVRVWCSEKFKEYLVRAREQRRLNETRSWERCQSMVSSAGKAMAMK